MNKGRLQKKKRSNLGFWLNLVWGPPAPQTWALLLGDFLLKSIHLKPWNILLENCGPPTIYPGKYGSYFQILYQFWYKDRIGLGEGWWGVRTFTYFIALFRVLKHLNHFKAIKKYLITGLGLQPPLRRPPALTSAKSPSLTFFFLKPSLKSLFEKFEIREKKVKLGFLAEVRAGGHLRGQWGPNTVIGYFLLL